MSPQGQVDAVLGTMGQVSGPVRGTPVSQMEAVASHTATAMISGPYKINGGSHSGGK